MMTIRLAKTALVVCLCISAAFLAMYSYPLIGHGVWLIPLAVIAVFQVVCSE